MNKHIVALALALATLTSVLLNVQIQRSENLTKDPPQTVPYVDLDRYLGIWYQQAAIPSSFQKACEGGTRANYTRNSDNTIRVDNKCYRDGVLNGSIGKAYPDPADTTKSNSKLKVQFNPFSKGDYWIVRLDEQYRHVVVSSPDYVYLWILSREQVIDQKLYDSIVADLKEDEFPVEKLKRTRQP